MADDYQRILGIDPGSRITGYGVIDSNGRHSLHVAHGCVRIDAPDIAGKLGVIFRGVDDVIEEFRPQVVAIEQVFVARNPGSALKLGQARGAAICAAVMRGLEVAEYSPRSIKQAVVGSGAADKAQVQHMISRLLNLKVTLPADAADALGVSLCHAHTDTSLTRMTKAVLGGRK